MSQQTPPSRVAPGDVLAGKYRVERVIGEGGMGVVVAATHLQLGQTVALKFIRSEALADPEIVARFVRKHHARMSGLTHREATRRLPAALQKSLQDL